jgi:hypothetical protein
LLHNRNILCYFPELLRRQTAPDYSFLAKKHNIHNLEELKAAVKEILKNVDLNVKKRDFEHLLFNKKNSGRILLIPEFFRELR